MSGLQAVGEAMIEGMLIGVVAYVLTSSAIVAAMFYLLHRSERHR